MLIERGILQDKSSKDISTKKGPSVIYSFKLNDDWYTSWDKSLFEAFNIGDEIRIDFIMNGEYRNIKSMLLVKATDGAPDEPEIIKETEVVGEPTPKTSGIKVIQSFSPEDWERDMMNFKKDHNVFATQPLINRCRKAGEEVDTLVYTAVLYYKK